MVPTEGTGGLIFLPYRGPTSGRRPRRRVRPGPLLPNRPHIRATWGSRENEASGPRRASNLVGMSQETLQSNSWSSTRPPWASAYGPGCRGFSQHARGGLCPWRGCVCWREQAQWRVRAWGRKDGCTGPYLWVVPCCKRRQVQAGLQRARAALGARRGRGFPGGARGTTRQPGAAVVSGCDGPGRQDGETLGTPVDLGGLRWLHVSPGRQVPLPLQLPLLPSGGTKTRESGSPALWSLPLTPGWAPSLSGGHSAVRSWGASPACCVDGAHIFPLWIPRSLQTCCPTASTCTPRRSLTRTRRTGW